MTEKQFLLAGRATRVCVLLGLKMPLASCSRHRGGGDGEGWSAEYYIFSRVVEAAYKR